MRNGLERLLGGRPIVVLAKLLFLCVVVGAVMAGLGLTPASLAALAVDAFRSVLGLGYDAIGEVGHFVVTGAVVVIPLWLLARLFAARR